MMRPAWGANESAAFMTFRWFRLLALGGMTLAPLMTAALAEDAEIAHRRALETQRFTDDQIIDGFFKVTFGAEFHIAGGVDRIRKYDGPILVYVDNRAQPDRSQQVGAVVADIRSRIRDLDIAITAKREDAQIIVSLVRDRDLAHAIRALYGIDRARRIQRSLEPQCLSGFRKDEESPHPAFRRADRRRRRRFRVLRLHLRGAVAVARSDQRRHHGAVDACSTTTSRWASSISTISTCSTSCTTGASARA